MKILQIIVLVIHIFAALGLIIAVLLHSGRGGGLSGAFGGSSSSMFSGSYVVEKNLDRITIVLGIVFAITTLLLLWLLAPK